MPRSVLTLGCGLGQSGLPKYNEWRTANAFLLSQGEEQAPEKALLKVLHIMPLPESFRRVRVHIGRAQRPVSVKTRQPLVGLGSVVPCLFFYPQTMRYPVNLSQSPASHGPELTTSTATSTAAACRRVFRRKNALRLPGDRTEQPPMPEDFACLAGTDRPTAAAVPSLHADALAARDALQRAAAGLTAYRQALAELRRVGYALLPRLCSDEGYASPIARPFIGEVLDAALYDAEQQLTDVHDKASAQAALLCRLAREVEECHA